MKEKKEVQQRINRGFNGNVSEEEFYSILKLISPGTSLRNALKDILNYGRGALIVLENDFLPPILDGGFRVNAKFTPRRLMELSKMDGAIVLSRDLKKILFANVTLMPSMKIKTSETGTRHKAAERTAKQIGGLTIAISEKKNEITLFYKNKRHSVERISEIMRRVNENLQILEKQRELFDVNLDALDQLEIKNYVSLNHAVKTIQRGKIIEKISNEVSKNLVELGKEGVILRTRLREILSEVQEETNLIIKDYSNVDPKKAIEVLKNLTYEELLDKERILKALDHDSLNKIVNVGGWRILSKTSLSEDEVSELIKKAGGVEKIISAEISDKVQFLPDEKFSLLKVELERLKLGI